MANLHVQPKRKNYVWIWILIILIIVAGIYYYFNYYKKGITPFHNNALREAPVVKKYAYATKVVRAGDCVHV
ncbi:MAG: hypothetical protein ACRDE8_15355 [Ginsengibacter sp.]